MALDPTQRSALLASANRLKAAVTIGATEPNGAAIAHVRQAFRKHELLKVRISTDDRDVCRQVAAALAERVPCELVQVVGRVAILYRAPGASGFGGADTQV